MAKIILYKFGIIGVLALAALWSFHALPDKNKDNKAILSEEFFKEPVASSSATPSFAPVLSPTNILILTQTPAPTKISTPVPSIVPTLTLTPSPTQAPTPTQIITPTPSSAVSGSPASQPTTTPSPTPSVTATPIPEQTQSCLIKGNIGSSGKIYHVPGCTSYSQTKINEDDGEKWFCTEEEAVAAGWTKAKNCPD